MTALKLDVRIDGFEGIAGTLHRYSDGGLRLFYDPHYVQTEHAMPMSLSLPLTEDPFGDVLTRAFFNNLLQERDAPLQRLMAREGISRDDIAGLLFHLGRDCPGAISVLPEGSPPVKVPGDPARDYVELSGDEMADIVSSLHHDNRFPAGSQDPSPLAGVQNKFAVTVLPNGNYAFPKEGSGAPTTHIIKVPKRNHAGDTKREAAALALSARCGISTVEAEVITFAGIETLQVRRYDRALNTAAHITRIHQEDFAQALGLPPELKYERYGQTGRRFDAEAIQRILSQTAAPAVSVSNFITAIFFDVLIGNTDGHAKNHALLYNGNRRPTLSPRYDLVPTRLDHTLTEEFSFTLGNAKSLEELTREDVDNFLSTMGIMNAAGRKRVLQNLVVKLSNEVEDHLDILQSQGQKSFADMIAANCRTLCALAQVDVPPSARNRDAFINSAAAWYRS